MTDAERYNRTKVVISYLLFCSLLSILKALFPLFTMDMVQKMIESVAWIPGLYIGIKSVENLIKQIKQPNELIITKKTPEPVQ